MYHMLFNDAVSTVAVNSHPMTWKDVHVKWTWNVWGGRGDCLSSGINPASAW